MRKRPGQNPDSPGRRRPAPTARRPLRWGWREYLSALTEAHGTLAAVAGSSSSAATVPEDVASVDESAASAGANAASAMEAWGPARLAPLLACRAPSEDRLRWMGLYHSPFNDFADRARRSATAVGSATGLSVAGARGWNLLPPVWRFASELSMSAPSWRRRKDPVAALSRDRKAGRCPLSRPR